MNDPRWSRPVGGRPSSGPVIRQATPFDELRRRRRIARIHATLELVAVLVAFLLVAIVLPLACTAR